MLLLMLILGKSRKVLVVAARDRRWDTFGLLFVELFDRVGEGLNQLEGREADEEGRLVVVED